MPGIVDHLLALEAPRMVGDDLLGQQHDDAIGIGAHQNAAAGGPGVDAVPVAVMGDEAGGRGAHGLLAEAGEGAHERRQGGALLNEHLPDGPVPELRMTRAPGVGATLVRQPGVEFLQRLDPWPRPEQHVAHRADLVLDLALLPA